MKSLVEYFVPAYSAMTVELLGSLTVTGLIL